MEILQNQAVSDQENAVETYYTIGVTFVDIRQRRTCSGLCLTVEKILLEIKSLPVDLLFFALH